MIKDFKRKLKTILELKQEIYAIEKAIQLNSFELILSWLEPKLSKNSVQNLERDFKRFLVENPQAYELMAKEYLSVYKLPEEEKQMQPFRLN